LYYVQADHWVRDTRRIEYKDKNVLFLQERTGSGQAEFEHLSGLFGPAGNFADHKSGGDQESDKGWNGFEVHHTASFQI
jgi:hypothetical protein